LQRIVLDRQCPGAVIPRVRESQQMSRPSAEWCARVPWLPLFSALARSGYSKST
jgi:hypothetical protein